MARARGDRPVRTRTVLQAAEFRASALAVLRRVRDTGVAVTVTVYGRPLARIVPPREEDAQPTGHGCMRDTCELHGSEVVLFPSRAARQTPGAEPEEE